MLWCSCHEGQWVQYNQQFGLGITFLSFHLPFIELACPCFAHLPHFSGQTLGQLLTLGQSVEEALEAGDGDPEYWEAVQKRLQIHKAKAQVRGYSVLQLAQYHNLDRSQGCERV